MRIGELAAAVGVTTRTVRHYHHLGLLPEPERLGNGYRDYTLRHAVVLARIRRLTELGLGLGEVRDVLAEDAGKDLVEVLTELDEDLARQEAAIRERRARLRALLQAGALPAEGPVSPELATLFGEVGQVSGSPMAAKDREILALLDTSATPETREQLIGLVGSAFATPGGVERAREAYALLDALADAGPDDPRVDEAARALADCLPAELLPEADIDHNGSFLRAFYADFAPAQAEAIRRTLRILTDPTDPTDPTDVTDPTDQTDVTDPTDPTEGDVRRR
ncbi:MerR family transcriptional regulator [Streptomyces resistomycificus]|uniref:MerR family transcriptional regulator n=1 Tax=Streptomyces resistomycificus TaxID=67356 RepID=UPI000998DFD6|nr:MerR family transcriptional regulator [Streptomyces resistomycificus]